MALLLLKEDILKESKRDNLLLPYVEILKSKGIETNIGQLKSYMLRKLANEGGMHNLSLQSNYYLAGAVRYYFNGDLTLNKELGIFTDTDDQWNEEVCERLNALINVLRNAYIDTIGEKFEQPEDFGTMPIAKLLRKYKKKIDAELNGNGETIENKDDEDTLDRNLTLGNGYTFEIMYNYDMAKKYERATSPGSWCVTYGSHHFHYYPSHTQPASHLVIFKQNGWEGIDRINGKDESKWVKDSYNGGRVPRPHDPYANSLIAFFQSNKSWEPGIFNGAPLITSRWNHGSEDTGTLEADRAYSLDEFMEITGISSSDLQHIYEIWEKDKDKYPYKANPSKQITMPRSEQQSAIRKLKYLQMRIRGGENPTINDFTIHTVLNANATDINNDPSKLNVRKSTLFCRMSQGDYGLYFLMDKGEINFDVLIPSHQFERIQWSQQSNSSLTAFILTKLGIYIYDVRKHSFLTIDGIYRFKSVSRVNTNIVEYYQILMSRFQRCLVRLSDNKPLKLPNGQVWFSEIFASDMYYNSSLGHSNESLFSIGKNSIVEIIYDSSSRERYFFSTKVNKFLPNISDDAENGEPHIMSNSSYICEISSFNWCAICYARPRFREHTGGGEYFYDKDRYFSLYDKDTFEKIVIDGHDKFATAKGIYPLLAYQTVEEYEKSPQFYNKMHPIYNAKSKKNLMFNGETIKSDNIDTATYSYTEDCRLLFIRGPIIYGTVSNEYMIYDKKNDSFLKNPSNYPSKYAFDIRRMGNIDGSGVMFYINGNNHRGYDDWSETRILNIPGVDNSAYTVESNDVWDRRPAIGLMENQF